MRVPATLLALFPALALAQPAPATVDVCFVPAQACQGTIVAAIDAARSEIRVEAYGFTATPIIAALLRARARGVDVAVLLDRSNEYARHSGLAAIAQAGIPVWIDSTRGIAHIKAIIIDRRYVIGGSYNFTVSAERRNVEDVTLLDAPDIAARFLRNWNLRRDTAAAAE